MRVSMYLLLDMVGMLSMIGKCNHNMEISPGVFANVASMALDSLCCLVCFDGRLNTVVRDGGEGRTVLTELRVCVTVYVVELVQSGVREF